MLNHDAELLIRDNLDLVNMIMYKHRRIWPVIPPDEMKSIMYLAMVSAADRWESYCEERGFDPGAVHYFRPYAVRRMSGAVNDTLRDLDPLSRAQRKKVKEEDGKTTMESVAGHLMSGYVLEPEDGVLESVSSKEPSQHSQTVVNTALAEVVKAIRELPFEVQVILALHYYQEMMMKDIAELMGSNESKVSKAHTEAVLVIAERLRASLS